MDDLDFYAYSDYIDYDTNWRAQLDARVDEGVTYWVLVHQWEDDDTLVRLRTAASYTGYVGEWIQPDSEQLVWGLHHTPAGVMHYPYDTDHRTHRHPLPGVGDRLPGRLPVQPSRSGEHPATDVAAVDCAWSFARCYQYGGFDYWSLYNGPTWNGTDPYDDDVPGGGNCPDPLSTSRGVRADPQRPPRRLPLPSVTTGVAGKNINLRSYGQAQMIGLHKLRSELSDMGWDYSIPDPYVAELEAAGSTDVEVEWESDDAPVARPGHGRR